jgi:hypothetical protein
MLTLSQLLILTDRERRKFKNNYNLEALQSGKGMDSRGEFTIFSSVVTGGSSPRKSVCRVYGELEAGSPCKVACTCAYFKIRLAIPLYLAGTTDIRIDKSEIPEKYLGIQTAGLCPHLLKLIETILNPNSTEFKRLKKQSRRVSISDKLKGLF